ncbi:AT-rich interactive domain-containing protein 1A-like [Phoenix dactylifera]|uniref:AT-rich interactive domain-containing protein 1A-like n=1 Tax=Phoenix dactylifera TaxID=42345 RepID=A0A8B9A761_PHODC|nr:AT-rich interactive domain-containing protein 1A-like [Phoenix dactylifera]
MDYSALTEAQQQQYHQQYQPQDHQAAAQPYDPAQAQAYEAYYASYHHPHYDSSAYHHPHHHYYPHDYSSYQPPPPAAQPDPVPAPSAAAAASAPHDPSQIHPSQPHHYSATAAAAGGHGYPLLSSEQQGSGSSSTSAEASYPVPPGLNPAAAAAVAALSQLTQFAGTMDAAERAMSGMQERSWHGKNGGMMGPGGPPPPPPHHHPQHPHHQPHHPHHHPTQHGAVSIRPGGGSRSPYRGGGRRGGGPFRGGGGGRGNFGHHPPRQDAGAAAPFRGRGRGRGQLGRAGSRRFHQSAPDSQQPNAAPAPAPAPGIEPTTPVPDIEQAPSQASALAAAGMLPRHSLLPIAWCDICRVDCNSLEILEQHKNGKRHKKTVQRIQEIQAQQKLMAELQANVALKPEIALQKAKENKADQVVELNESSDQVDEAKKASAASENIPSAVLSNQAGEVKNSTASDLSNQAGEVNKAFSVSEGMTAADFSDQAIEANKGSASSENLPVATVTMEHQVEFEMQSQNADGQSEPAKEGEAGTMTALSDASHSEAPQMEGHVRRPWMGGHDRYDRRRGPKRKMMRFGRGGKRLRSFEPVRSKPPERLKERPRVCTLCNVMCDTLAVFESHLSGKKHLSRIKRFQGQDTVYGPISVYIPPNQPMAYPPQAPEPLFYGLQSHEMLQQEAYGLQGLPAEGYGLQQGNQAKQTTESEGAGLVSRVEERLEHPANEIPADGAQEAVAMKVEGQTAISEFEEKEPSQSLTVSEAATMEEVPTTEDVVPHPAYGTTPGDGAVLPGLDIRVEELNAGNGEPGNGVDTASH